MATRRPQALIADSASTPSHLFHLAMSCELWLCHRTARPLLRLGPAIDQLDCLVALHTRHAKPRTLRKVGSWTPGARSAHHVLRIVFRKEPLGPLPTMPATTPSVCSAGGSLTCAFTHAGITPLDVTQVTCRCVLVSRLSSPSPVCLSCASLASTATPSFAFHLPAS